jgi:hypothetical protein
MKSPRFFNGIGFVGHRARSTIPNMFFLLSLTSGIWHRKRFENYAQQTPWS